MDAPADRAFRCVVVVAVVVRVRNSLAPQQSVDSRTMKKINIRRYSFELNVNLRAAQKTALQCCPLGIFSLSQDLLMAISILFRALDRIIKIILLWLRITRFVKGHFHFH